MCQVLRQDAKTEHLVTVNLEGVPAPGMVALPSGLSKINRCNHSVYASNLYGRLNSIKYSYRAVGEVLRPETLPGNLHTKGALRKRRGPNGQRVRLSVLRRAFFMPFSNRIGTASNK